MLLKDFSCFFKPQMCSFVQVVFRDKCFAKIGAFLLCFEMYDKFEGFVGSDSFERLEGFESVESFATLRQHDDKIEEEKIELKII